MKYYKYNKKIYREDDKGTLWEYVTEPRPKYNWAQYVYDGQWRRCSIGMLITLKHHLKRKRACEKTETEVFIEII